MCKNAKIIPEWPVDDGFASNRDSKIVTLLAPGMIVDSYIIPDSEFINNKTDRCVYPYQTPMFLRNLPGVETGNVNFLNSDRYH